MDAGAVAATLEDARLDARQAKQLDAITSEAELHALDRALVVISVDPDVGERLPSDSTGPRLRQYVDDVERVCGAGRSRSRRRAARRSRFRCDGPGPARRRHVADGEVEALGTGGRHDVRGVTGKEEAAVPHGLGDVERRPVITTGVS
jgi:hypothetical protein